MKEGFVYVQEQYYTLLWNLMWFGDVKHIWEAKISELGSFGIFEFFQ